MREAPHCCIICYTRSVITFRGRKGLYNAAVGLQLTHGVTPHTFNPYATLACLIMYFLSFAAIIADSISSFKL